MTNFKFVIECDILNIGPVEITSVTWSIDHVDKNVYHSALLLLRPLMSLLHDKFAFVKLKR